MGRSQNVLRKSKNDRSTSTLRLTSGSVPSKRTLTPHERSILAEQKVELENGQFRVSGSFQMYRLEDRLLFLCHRFSKKTPLDKKAAYWGNFRQALDLRNTPTHPKTPPPKVTEQSVERALLAILQLLDVVYQRIYNKKYPARQLGLDSNEEV